MNYKKLGFFATIAAFFAAITSTSARASISNGATLSFTNVYGSTLRKSLVDEFIKVAQSYHYVREVAPNRSPDIDKFNTYVPNVPKGSFWCMTFWQYCFNEACKKLAVNNTIYVTGHCMSFSNKFKKQDFKNAYQIRPGDIFIVKLNNKGDGHTGIITYYDKANQIIHTIEGNSNNSGSNNGDRVAIKTNRKLSTVYAIHSPYEII